MIKKIVSAAACSMFACASIGVAMAQTTAPAGTSGTNMGTSPSAGVTHAATGGTRADYDAAVKKANADYKTAKEKCEALKGNAEDVCSKEAKGAEKVAKAEAEAARDGTDRARMKAAKVKADADYDVAKEKCDDLKGNDKDVCRKEAKAAHTQAATSVDVRKAQATGSAKEVAEARHDASKDRTDANYKAAKEKCDALSGNSKDKCEADVKTKYGK
jgi:hypothetical protein